MVNGLGLCPSSEAPSDSSVSRAFKSPLTIGMSTPIKSNLPPTSSPKLSPRESLRGDHAPIRGHALRSAPQSWAHLGVQQAPTFQLPRLFTFLAYSPFSTQCPWFLSSHLATNFNHESQFLNPGGLSSKDIPREPTPQGSSMALLPGSIQQRRRKCGNSPLWDSWTLWRPPIWRWFYLIRLLASNILIYPHAPNF